MSESSRSLPSARTFYDEVGGHPIFARARRALLRRRPHRPGARAALPAGRLGRRGDPAARRSSSSTGAVRRPTPRSAAIPGCACGTRRSRSARPSATPGCRTCATAVDSLGLSPEQRRHALGLPGDGRGRACRTAAPTTRPEGRAGPAEFRERTGSVTRAPVLSGRHAGHRRLRRRLRGERVKTRDLAYIALFAAITAVLGLVPAIAGGPGAGHRTDPRRDAGRLDPGCPPWLPLPAAVPRAGRRRAPAAGRRRGGLAVFAGPTAGYLFAGRSPPSSPAC